MPKTKTLKGNWVKTRYYQGLTQLHMPVGVSQIPDNEEITNINSETLIVTKFGDIFACYERCDDDYGV